MSWLYGRHFYWADNAKTILMCEGYRIPDEYIPTLEQKLGEIDTWDPRLDLDDETLEQMRGPFATDPKYDGLTEFPGLAEELVD